MAGYLFYIISFCFLASATGKQRGLLDSDLSGLISSFSSLLHTRPLGSSDTRTRLHLPPTPLNLHERR